MIHITHFKVGDILAEQCSNTANLVTYERIGNGATVVFAFTVGDPLDVERRRESTVRGAA